MENRTNRGNFNKLYFLILFLEKQNEVEEHTEVEKEDKIHQKLRLVYDHILILGTCKLFFSPLN